MKLTKQQALEKIEELKKYVAEEETKGYAIRNRYDDSEIYVSKCDNVRDAVIEAVGSGANLSEANLWRANLRGANLRGANLWRADLREADLSEADLWEADLREADLYRATFYGKGGTVKLKKDQVEDFLNALGFQIIE